MDQLPRLAPVPSTFHDLTYKAGLNGVTIMQEGRFKQRYTGSKKCAVDINGNLWLNATELKKFNASGDDKPKKKARHKDDRPQIIVTNRQQISDDLSTWDDNLLTTINLFSPKVGRKKEYTINKREVRQRLLGFLNTQAGKKELYFWTVTFPMGTPDGVCYKIFNVWLTQLRKYKMLKNYLWIAERQPQKTKTIHFHIAIPHRMDVKRANAMMQGTLKTYAKRGEIPFTVHQCKRYNGVDIAKNRNTKRVTNFAVKKGQRALTTYLTKYITKNDGVFEHLAWHNSRGFSCLFTGVTFTLQEFENYGFTHLLNKHKVYRNDFFAFIPWEHGPPFLLEAHLFKLNSFIQSQLN